MIAPPTEVANQAPAFDATGAPATPVDRLERTALETAASQTLTPPAPLAQSLTDQLAALASVLQQAQQQITASMENALGLSYAAEWLLDNYYVVEQAVVEVEQDMPAGFYRKLPKIGAGVAMAGYPRIYALARAFLALEDYHVDSERLARYVLTYQQLKPLTLSEVWALPVMLRLALLEVLAIGAAHITRSADVEDEIAALQRRFTLENGATERPPNYEDIVASAIPSLRQLDVLDWLTFSERISVVHRQLENDPAGVYPYLDFDTRNRYRSRIEELAQRTTLSELEIAVAAIDLASTAQYAARLTDGRGPPIDGFVEEYPGLRLAWPPACHVGYFLIDAGRRQFETRIGYRSPPGEMFWRWAMAHPTFVYLGVILTFTLLVIGLTVGYAIGVGAGSLGLFAAILLTLVPASTIGVSLTEFIITRLLPPRVLPKLAFEEGVPASCSSLVVIPGMIGNTTEVDDLLDQLEQHFLRNPDPALRFAVLTDFHDAAEAERPEDATLMAHARARLESLNERYPHRPFHFLHRRRLWNPSEQVWMGWERKRGKLHELNRLLRGATDTSFTWLDGDTSQLARTRYVITLDADTLLPREGARRLIGTLAHPLNRARFDPHTGRVVAGYTVLQPRVEIKPTSADRSLFTRVFAGDTGLDLYTLAVSDVYQDLFGAGIYIGKGIYDVDAFERSLEGRISENTLLSHDLFEGIHGRAGLVTDIVVYEDYPPNYLVDVRRSHRWVRGDWQLLPWLLPATPRVGGKGPNDLPLIDRWKLFDNLRRSVLPVALLALFFFGWTVLPGSPLFWTLIGLLTPLVALVAGTLTSLLRLATGGDRTDWQGIVRSLRDGAIRWLLFLAFLPVEAWLTLDAVARTLVRMFVTRRRMLEWTTAARSVQIFGNVVTPMATLRTMTPAVVFVLISDIFLMRVRPESLPVAAPLLLAWLLALPIAYWISQPIRSQVPAPTPEERHRLRALARRTWLFYAQFVGPDDNWLPPDHFQESPNGVVAHRTSPTNVGLYLLSALAAHDMGYLGTAEFTLRVDFAFNTLNQLERYRGHFLNWIDTGSLQPLAPRYVSTVDSGNLAACLIALKHGCLEISEQPVWHAQRWDGLADTVTMVLEVLSPLESVAGEEQQALRRYLDELEQRIVHGRRDPREWWPLLANLTSEGRNELERLIGAVAENSAGALDAETLRTGRIYVARAFQHLDNLQRELDTSLPWLTWLQAAPALLVGPKAPEPIRNQWNELIAGLPTEVTWGAIPEMCNLASARLDQIAHTVKQIDVATNGTGAAGGRDVAVDAALRYCEEFADALAKARATTSQLLDDLARIAVRADTYVAEMDFSFLYDEKRHVFHIGYNVDSGILDNSYYDLLASEARIASLLAIAKGDVPQRHWLHLARPVTRVGNGSQALLSWSGTMFEYLMPPLLLRSFPGTLLHQTALAAIDQQIAYGRQKEIPWGISESGFFAFDAALNYQYRAFGVPGLGFKRGLADDVVIAPYASILALPFRPREVIRNLARMQEMKLIGRYGLYEAVDFTAGRLNVGQEYAVVRSYMAHHQGMILLALAAYLQGPKMVDRFHAEPMNRSVDLLLQEQIPHAPPLHFPHQDETDARAIPPVEGVHPWRTPPDPPMPLVHYLSNGAFSTMITDAGGGYCQFGDLMLTRWRADTTLDDWGSWLYLRDMESGATWSAGRQPSGVRGEHEEIVFLPHAAEFRRRDGGISLHMQVTVAPDDNVEIRRVTLTNDSDRSRRLGIATYSEVVLAPAGADRRHQAFTKLFVESEYLEEMAALLMRRRPRASTETATYLLHMLVPGPGTEGEVWGQGCFEGDRSRFLGRGRTAAEPVRLGDERWWSGEDPGTAGATLDPIMTLGQIIHLPPRASVQLAILTVAGNRRHDAVELAQRFSAWTSIERALLRAQSQADRELRQFGPRGDAFPRAHQLLSLLTYPHPARRSDATTLAANRKGQPGLWGYGISGDYPILLLRLDEENHGELLLEVLQAHRYWRRRGLFIDMVILNEQDTNYGQSLQNYIYRLIRRLDSDAVLNQRGGIFLLLADQMGEEDRMLLKAAARVVLDGRLGALAPQLGDIYQTQAPLPPFAPVPGAHRAGESEALLPVLTRPAGLLFDNGLGGFSPDGNEYILYLPPGVTTPAPWINVVANPEIGFIASESGGGYTWAANSGENRLTTWQNDPVTDMPAEAIYLRDEETAEVWTPTPLPAPADAPYLVRHGAGYTIYEHRSHGLDQSLRLFVAPDAPVKVLRLRLANRASHSRRLTVTFYAEWVLGVDRATTVQFLVPEFDSRSGALLVRNPYSTEFDRRVAFAAATRDLHGMTADRTEFLGRLGSHRRPAALGRIGLSNRVQAGLDTCAVLQVHIDLPAGGEEEVCFLLGQAEDAAKALALVKRFQTVGAVAAAREAVRVQWDQILGAVTVETPDPAMNLLLNRWLLYQSLACRVWGRSALYQSSGAYGFRDQLQDVMALVHARPDIARSQILRAARHQFEAGDVLHWWHPPSSRGVRTRISDDLLWLPYVTAHYVAATGDRSILQARVPFLAGEPLRPHEEERYSFFPPVDTELSLLEHCRRALEKGLTAGPHGIPLIGAGDWNDGMNRVGIEGKGESIWLGWFIHATLEAFASHCVEAPEEAAAYRSQAETVRRALEQHGWDGAWYRRAYYDDGTPLGSAQNRECQIDAIAQSWSVLSGAAEPARARQAMQAVLAQLVKRDARLILLFAPPFDKTPRDPGYVKGYLPGIRENGGQYTHAAMWTIWAVAALGDGDEAEALFRLVNPIYRSDTPAKRETYKVEPYVIAADVYGVAPHTGRGGWTWYTGSASWMYRVGLDAILGMRRPGDRLHIEPCIPRGWEGYTLHVRHGASLYTVKVANPNGAMTGVKSVTLDGVACPDGTIPFVDDGQAHRVQVQM